MGACREIHVVELPKRQVDFTTRANHPDHCQRWYISVLQKIAAIGADLSF